MSQLLCPHLGKKTKQFFLTSIMCDFQCASLCMCMCEFVYAEQSYAPACPFVKQTVAEKRGSTLGINVGQI